MASPRSLHSSIWYRMAGLNGCYMAAVCKQVPEPPAAARFSSWWDVIVQFTIVELCTDKSSCCLTISLWPALGLLWSPVYWFQRNLFKLFRWPARPLSKIYKRICCIPLKKIFWLFPCTMQIVKVTITIVKVTIFGSWIKLQPGNMHSCFIPLLYLLGIGKDNCFSSPLGGTHQPLDSKEKQTHLSDPLVLLQDARTKNKWLCFI